MPLRERAPEQGPEHGRRQPLREATTGHGEFDAILVQTLPGADRLNPMRMPPCAERTSHLFVAELPSRNVTLMGALPSAVSTVPRRRRTRRTAVLQSAGLALDRSPEKVRGRRFWRSVWAR